MIANRLRRLLSMDRTEMRFRASAALRREASRFASITRPPHWRRVVLADALRDDDPALRTALDALRRHDWMGAHRSLMRHMVARPARFILAPMQRQGLVAAILENFPGAPADAARRADLIASGYFDLLGYRRLAFQGGVEGADIEWHVDPVHGRRAPRIFWSRVQYLEPACGDHKIVWELNRHQYWLALGRAFWLTNDERYRNTFVEHLESWMRSNPPLMGMNWASMLELALRSLSWLWALHFFAVDRTDGHGEGSPWAVDLLLGLDRQLILVEQNLSRYFSPNTHLLGEALALYVTGRTLPELRRASAWERIGRRVLLEEIPRQINADGGHAERSTHYHRYTLDFYLLALAVARRTDDREAPAFAAAAMRLAQFARTISDDTGRLPGFGDDDGGSLFPICGREPSDASDSLRLAAQLLDQPALAVGAPAEEVVWVCGDIPRVSVRRQDSAALPQTGYYVSRSDRGDHLTVDAGPHGYLNGGHAHADALSVTLTVRGLPFLIDPGTGCYTFDAAVRDRFRSTRLHNTVTLDERSQSIPDGPFHWRSAAHGKALEWQSGTGFDYFEGDHDGYDPLVHHRSVLARPGCWFVVDRVLGSGRTRSDAHWHLHPAWRATVVRPNCVRAEHDDGTMVWILSPCSEFEIFSASTDGSGLGWCAPLYGPLVPTTSIRATRSDRAPFAIATVVIESREEPRIESVPVRPAPDAVAFRIQVPSWTETVIFTRRLTSAPQAQCQPQVWCAGGLETDAKVLCWRDVEGENPAVTLMAGTIARRQGDRSQARQSQSALFALEPARATHQRQS